MKKKDIISGLIVICLGVLLFVLSFFIRRNAYSHFGSAALLPRIVACLLVFLGSLVVVSGTKTAGEKKESGFDFRPLRQVVLSLASMVVYYLLLKRIGYIIMTTLLVFFQMLIMSNYEKKKIPLFFGISVAVVVASYFLFSKVFLLMLPYGILG